MISKVLTQWGEATINKQREAEERNEDLDEIAFELKEVFVVRESIRQYLIKPTLRVTRYLEEKGPVALGTYSILQAVAVYGTAYLSGQSELGALGTAATNFLILSPATPLLVISFGTRKALKEKANIQLEE